MVTFFRVGTKGLPYSWANSAVRMCPYLMAGIGDEQMAI